MSRLTLRSALAGLVLVAGSFALAQQCECNPSNQRVTYIVVEMPDQPVGIAATTTPASTIHVKAPAEVPSSVESFSDEPTSVTTTLEPTHSKPGSKPVYDGPSYGAPIYNKPSVEKGEHPGNTTHVFKPCSAPKVDRTDLKNLVPARNVSLYYSSEKEDEQGTINMELAFNNPAVVLEHVEDVSKVVCSDSLLTVTFANLAGFKEAIEDWDIDEPFVLITGATDKGCAAEFERGFFVVDDVTSDASKLTIRVSATKGELPDLAGELEMSFTSLPAATLTRRLTLNPKYSLNFAEGLDGPTTIFSDGKHIEITAEEAWFSSTLTFSGKLKYNFWGFKLKELYFDIDAEFDASSAVSARINAAFEEAVSYKPDALAYSLVDVPGVISLGPGVAFGLAVDVEASAAVDLYAGVDISIPAGNVHVDFLDGDKTGTSGWEPLYDSFANISQAADVRLDVGADVTVMLQFKLLGGLVDLSSGVTASPGFANTFKLRGEQDARVNGTVKGINAGINIPKNALECADTNGIEFISDFLFSVSAYATKWWNKELYNVRVPVVDYCLPF
jgi:hypothetical protein